MIQASTRLQSFTASGILSAIDYAPTAGKLRIYSGDRPSNCGALGVGNFLLIEYDLSKPCGTVSGTILSINPPAAKQVSLTGTASFMRIVDGYDNVILDIDASNMGMNVLMTAGKYTGIDYIRIDTGI